MATASNAGTVQTANVQRFEALGMLIARTVESFQQLDGPDRPLTLTLRPDFLPGTEVRLQRTATGSVEVVFIANDAASLEVLNRHQEVLAQRLQGLVSDVRIESPASLRELASEQAALGTGRSGGDQQSAGKDLTREQQTAEFEEEPLS